MTGTILIADDDRAFVRMMSQTMEKEGFSVVCAYDGAEAIKRVQDQSFDLILLDIQMPKVNGYSFIFELHKIEGMRSIPVIVLTSFTEMEDMFTAEGVKEYLVKPCPPQTVLEKVKQYIKSGNQ